MNFTEKHMKHINPLTILGVGAALVSISMLISYYMMRFTDEKMAGAVLCIIGHIFLMITVVTAHKVSKLSNSDI